MSIKEELNKAMQLLAKDPETIFIGYNIHNGSKSHESLKDVNPEQIVEMPVAENLMLSSAIGMSIAGLKPVVFFERFDFIMNAMDALVNHLDKIEALSGGEYTPKVIIRCVIGGKEKPFFTGLTHTQDFTDSIKKMVSFPVIKITSAKEVLPTYETALKGTVSMIIIEEKDRYEQND